MDLADGSDTGMFCKGETFSTFQELEKKIEQFKRVSFVDLWIRDSRTVAAAQKRLTKSLKPELKYYELKLACVHGGRTFKSENKGKRSSQ